MTWPKLSATLATAILCSTLFLIASMDLGRLGEGLSAAARVAWEQIQIERQKK